MVERIIELTSNSSNVHEVVDDNSNSYRNKVIDAMRMNQGHTSQCPIIDKEPNAHAIKFFYPLKDSDEPLWDGFINYSKLSVVTQVFNIKSDNMLSEDGYDKIGEWVKNILPERNRLKVNFYTTKSIKIIVMKSTYKIAMEMRMSQLTKNKRILINLHNKNM
jgi:hypothetical protein